MSVIPNIKKPAKHRASKEHYGWNPSTCACECDKAWEIGQHLKYSECMKSFVDYLIVTHDDIEDTSESAVVNHSNRIGYYLISAALLSIACLLLIHMKRELAIPCLLSY